MADRKDFSILLGSWNGEPVVTAILIGAEVSACAGEALKYQLVNTRRALRNLKRAVRAYRQRVRLPQVDAVLDALAARLEECLSALAPQWLCRNDSLPKYSFVRCHPQILLNGPNNRNQ